MTSPSSEDPEHRVRRPFEEPQGRRRPLAESPAHLELDAALQQSEPHLGRGEVAVVGEHVVHEKRLLRAPRARDPVADPVEEGLSLIHISEPTRLGMISYAVFCLKK